MRLLDGTFTQRRHVSDSNAVSDAAGTARSVAVIMDGNGRWAEARGLPVAAGHREGTRALRRTVEAAIDMGVHSLAVYAFSTENWARPADEVGTLMEILGDTIDRELPDLARQGVRTRFVGRRDRVPADLRARMEELEAATAHLDTLSLWIAFDYGGRAELVEAARAYSRGRARCRRRRRGGGGSAPLRIRAARDRPPHPHVGRAADLELHAVAGGVCRARVHGDAVARLRCSRPAATRSTSSRVVERRFGAR